MPVDVEKVVACVQRKDIGKLVYVLRDAQYNINAVDQVGWWFGVIVVVWCNCGLM